MIFGVGEPNNSHHLLIDFHLFIGWLAHPPWSKFHTFYSQSLSGSGFICESFKFENKKSERAGHFRWQAAGAR